MVDMELKILYLIVQRKHCRLNMVSPIFFFLSKYNSMNVTIYGFKPNIELKLQRNNA